MSDVFSSIFANVNAFVYRCRNDADYTMEYMEGAVRALSGYERSEILGNSTVSYVGLMVDEDTERVVADVDAAIAQRTSWDTFYHITHKNGHRVPVRERGAAIFEDGELAYLEGLIVGADAESELISRITTMLADTQAVNDEIVALTTKITSSLRHLGMLSINARIEAARSGDAGRGFAVVANEMKALADENTQWAQIIRDTLQETGETGARSVLN